MRFTLNRRQFELTREDIEWTMRDVTPNPTTGINRYVTQINGAWFPIKQPVGQATGLGPAEFNAHSAHRILSRLGFEIRDLNGSDGVHETEDIGTLSSAKRKFVVTIEQDEDGYYVVSCPSLKGCHSQGRTRQEALLNISEAIRAYLESMKKRGEEAPVLETVEVEVAA